MKHTAIIFITLVYLVSCVGIAVNKFYCCGKLKTVSLSATVANVINEVSSAKKTPCCNHTSQNFKVKDQHMASGTVLMHSAPFVTLQNNYYSLVEVQSLSIKEISTIFYHAPPNPSGTRIYNLYCNYRIWFSFIKFRNPAWLNFLCSLSADFDNFYAFNFLIKKLYTLCSALTIAALSFSPKSGNSPFGD